MCVFELVLGGDEKGGEVLGQEAIVGGRVGKQDLRILKDFRAATSMYLGDTSNRGNLLGHSSTASPCHQAVHLWMTR